MGRKLRYLGPSEWVKIERLLNGGVPVAVIAERGGHGLPRTPENEPFPKRRTEKGKKEQNDFVVSSQYVKVAELSRSVSKHAEEIQPKAEWGWTVL